MTKWMISLDESGTLDNNKNYFIIAGIIYKYEDFELVRDYFVPLVDKLCDITGVEELHARKMGKHQKQFCKTVIFSHIGYFDKIRAVVYIIDKNKTRILKNYDQKSWKYNKILEFLYKDLVFNNIISDKDEIAFLLDEMSLSDVEQDNLYRWLKERYKNVIGVWTGDSKNFRFIQMADIIANSFSKDGKCYINSLDMLILNPFIEVFPRKYKNQYIDRL